MGSFLSRRRIVFADRNIFTAIPFFALGVGGEDLLRGIQSKDTVRSIGAIGLVLQGLFAAAIFIRDKIEGRSWRCRNLAIFLVGGITGLLVGLLIYYPMTLDFNRTSRSRIRNETNITNISSSYYATAPTTLFNSTVNLNLTEPSPTALNSPPDDPVNLVSKLWFLVPNLGISLLVVVNTVYGLSIKLKNEKRHPVAEAKQELETFVGSREQFQ